MKTEDILQGCMDDVLAGRKTPAECAALFKHLPELGAYLSAAVALQMVHALTLSPATQQRVEAHLLRRAALLRQAERPAARRVWRPLAGLRWAAATATIATVLLAGAGAAAASGNSVPGDLLYGVKRADESAQVFFSPVSVAMGGEKAVLMRDVFFPMTFIAV